MSCSGFEDDPVAKLTGASRLHLALERGDGRDTEEIITRESSSGGASVRDESGATPLHYGATRGNLEAIQTLLLRLREGEGGQTRVKELLAAVDEEGRTALHWASANEKVEVVKLLISVGADASCRDDAGRTPLHSAAFAGHVRAMRVLIEAGSDPLAVSDKGTPLDMATKASRQGCIEILSKYAKEEHYSREGRADTRPKDEKLLPQPSLNSISNGKVPEPPKIERHFSAHNRYRSAASATITKTGVQLSSNPWKTVKSVEAQLERPMSARSLGPLRDSTHARNDSSLLKLNAPVPVAALPQPLPLTKLPDSNEQVLLRPPALSVAPPAEQVPGIRPQSARRQGHGGGSAHQKFLAKYNLTERMNLFTPAK